MFEDLSQSLDVLKQQNLYRKLVESDLAGGVIVRRGRKKFISFCSNDYLGMAQNAAVKKAAIDAVKRFGVGSGASRYITGNNNLYSKLEKQIAKIKKCDDAIVFSSGYQTAIGALPALVGTDDLVVADKLIHASLLDGIKLSGAKLLRFRHNDILHCQKLLAENRNKYRKCLIVTESIFSMDGDCCDAKNLGDLAKKFDAILFVDYAHDLFIADVCDGLDCALIKMGTLSKAVGVLGGYVAANKILINYLRNFARSAIYTTALPPCVLAAAEQSLKIIAKKNLGKKALKNAQYFCELMNLPKPDSAIVAVIIGDNKKVLQIAKNVEKKGMLISAIRPPTVEPNGARLRITFSALHKKAQIDKLAECLKREAI